jgi:hypothetical protein
VGDDATVTNVDHAGVCIASGSQSAKAMARWIDPDAAVSGADDDIHSNGEDEAGGQCLSVSLRAA